MTGRIGRTLALLAAAMLGGCGGPDEATVRQGWVRLPANPGAPAAAYFTLAGGRAADALTGVAAAGAARAEMHESMTHGGMATMTPLARVAVPAGGSVAFAPGGRHVMLFGLGRGVTPGATLAMTFVFASGARRVAPLQVVGPGEPAPH